MGKYIQSDEEKAFNESLINLPKVPISLELVSTLDNRAQGGDLVLEYRVIRHTASISESNLQNGQNRMLQSLLR